MIALVYGVTWICGIIVRETVNNYTTTNQRYISAIRNYKWCYCWADRLLQHGLTIAWNTNAALQVYIVKSRSLARSIG